MPKNQKVEFLKETFDRKYGGFTSCNYISEPFLQSIRSFLFDFAIPQVIAGERLRVIESTLLGFNHCFFGSGLPPERVRSLITLLGITKNEWRTLQKTTEIQNAISKELIREIESGQEIDFPTKTNQNLTKNAKS